MARKFVASSSQYLSAPNDASLQITGAITIACQFLEDGTQTTGLPGLISKWVPNGNLGRSYHMFYVASTAKSGGAVSSSGAYQSANEVVGPAYTGSDWKHCGFVFTPSTSVQAFSNGTAGTAATVGIAASINSNTSELRIALTETTLYFSGSVAETAIWSAALTDAEITSLAKGFKPSRIRPQSLVFYGPLINNLTDIRGARTLTNNNSATVADHPRVY